MGVGDLLVLSNSQSTGWKDGTIGICIQVELVGRLFKLYWLYMPTGEEVPFWEEEIELLDKEG